MHVPKPERQALVTAIWFAVGVAAGASSVVPGTFFVWLPLSLSVALISRAGLTRKPADVALGAFAVPCLLVSVWALYRATFTTPGVYWGGFIAMTAGAILAVLVLLDTVLTHVARPRVELWPF